MTSIFYSYTTPGGGSSVTPVVLNAKDTHGNSVVFNLSVFVFDPRQVCAPAPSPQLSSGSRQAESVIRKSGRELDVQPNPGSGRFTVKTFDLVAPRVSFEIYNENGKLIERKSVGLSGKTASLTVTFNLERHGSGMYYIKALTDKGVQTGKVVIQR